MEKIKISELKPLTNAEKNIIKQAALKEITYDEDCPAIAPELLEEFKAVVKEQRARRRKNIIALSVSDSTMEKAKALGPGYSEILSRMLDLCLNDPNIIKKCL